MTGPERAGAVVHQVVRHGPAVHGEDAAALQADAGRAERLAQVGERPGPVGQVDLQVARLRAHRRHPNRTAAPTSTGTASEDAT